MFDHRPSPLRVDVGQLLRSKAPAAARRLPSFAVRALERFICQDRINSVLEQTAGLRDADFCAGVLRCLDVDYSVEGLENLPPVAHRRVTFVSNHPLGGLDGICLIDFITRRYGPGMKFVVNDLLMALQPLHGVFVPVNKHGAQSRSAAADVDAAFAADHPVCVFPAGLCSRLDSQGRVRDLRWNKMFVAKSAEAGRTVVPLHFHGRNSRFFYTFARLRSRLGMKFNLEQLRLPRELFRAEGSRFRISVLPPVPASALLAGPQAAATAEQLRRLVYSI